MTLTPIGANNSIGVSESGVSNTNQCARQYLYGPLVAQTISGTLKGQTLALESVDTDNCCSQLRAYAVSPALVVRGVLVEVNNAPLTNEMDAADFTNCKIPRGWSGDGTAMTPVTIQGGDYVVVEIGFRQFSAAANIVNFNIIGNSTDDLPENETSQQSFNSWVEFSNSLFPVPGHAGRGGPRYPAPKGKMVVAAPGEVRGPSGAKRAPSLEGAPLPQDPQPAAQSYMVPIKSPPPTGRPVPESARPAVAATQVVAHITNPPPMLKLASIAKMPVNQILEQLTKADKK